MQLAVKHIRCNAMQLITSKTLAKGARDSDAEGRHVLTATVAAISVTQEKDAMQAYPLMWASQHCQ